ncbi:MAG: ATP-dependent helicase [Gemmataceae bacterium]
MNDDWDKDKVDLLEDLTASQREAVTHLEGPLLVVAGPGSGKTRVITRRVAYLIQQGIRPRNILAITFTNKAAGEMRQRIESLVPNCRVWISTFHSLGARLLREYAERIDLEKNFTIYDQTDRVKVVKSAIEQADLDNVKFTPETIMGAISRAKNQLLTPPKYGHDAKDFFTQTVAHVYPIYEKRMRDANAFDFDDLLYQLALVLKNRPDLRAELDERFRYVLVDEYQDTNKAQYEIARAFSKDNQNICVVGDPDQSIYKFRGSDIRNILDFERDYPQARTITLAANYRSTRAILRTASHLIAFNSQRKSRGLTTENPEGVPVGVITFKTSVDEADGIVRRIQEAVKSGKRKYHDFAIFLRMNALTRTLESAFVKHRVPFQIVRGLAFYDRKENRDILAYLRLLVNPRDDVSFLRIINEPARGIGKVSLQRLVDYAEPRELPLLDAAGEVDRIDTIKGKARKGLKQFYATMANLREFLSFSPDVVLKEVIDQTGYRDMLATGDSEDDQRLANVEELITAAKQFGQENDEHTIIDFLENITLASDLDGWDETQDCVSVMTLHASKGLEFPVVYMMAVEEGILPHHRAQQKEEEVEEERRLAFVGMTRAKEELYLTLAEVREFRGQTLWAEPSGFLFELPEEGIDREHLGDRDDPTSAANQFRTGTTASEEGWIDAGVAIDHLKKQNKPRGQDDPVSESPAKVTPANPDEYTVGSVVLHEKYGAGKITQVHGVGATQTVKVLFPSHGERSFRAKMAKLQIVSRG